MLQRNVSGGPLVLPTLDPPAEVLPGDTIEHPELLAGFEEVGPDETVTEPAYDPARTVMDLRAAAEQSTQDNEKAAPSATTDEEVTE